MIQMTPKTWNAHNINDGTIYTAKFTIDSGVDALVPVEAILASAAVGAPKYQRRHVNERKLVLHITIVNKTQANAEQLLNWFDSSWGEVVLVATPASGADRQINAVCISRSAVKGADSIWEFVLVAADGRWQTAEATTAWTVASSGSTQAITNSGTTLSYPRIRIKPHVQKGDSGTANAAVTTASGPPGTLTDTRKAWATNQWAGATVFCNGKTIIVASNTGTVITGTGGWSGGTNPGNGNAYSISTGWVYRRRIFMFNRSDQPLASPNGAIGYPFLLLDGNWDHAALVTAGKSLASGDDVLATVDGAETNRQVDAWNTSTTKLWSPIFFPPKRSGSFGPSGLPNNGTTIAVQPVSTNISNWPSSGFVGSSADAEILYYSSRDDWNLYDLHRAQLGTSYESWGAGSIAYPLMHDVQLLYGYLGAGSVSQFDQSTDLQPIIDMANSTNATHKWATNFWNRTTRQSRQFVPEYKERNTLDTKVSLADAAEPSFRDTPGQFPKNALTIDCPVPIDNAASAITHDVSLPASLAMLVYGQDLAGNSDVLLKTIYDGSSDEGSGKTITPASNLAQLRYEVHNLAVTGCYTADAGDASVDNNASKFRFAQGFVLDANTSISVLTMRLKKTGGGTGNAFINLFPDTVATRGRRTTRSR